MNRWAVIAGWVAGIAWGTLMLAEEHFKSATHVLSWLGQAGNLYIAVSAVLLNVEIAVGGSRC